MRPITVTVGPVTNAGTPTAIANAQGATVAGQLLLAPTPPGGAYSQSFQGTGSVAGDLLTITASTIGALTVGARLMANGLPPNCVVTGIDPDTPNTWIINPPAPAPLATRQVRANVVSTLDVPREVQVVNTEAAGNGFTVYGTNEDGQAIQETLATNGGNLTTSLNFATVTQVIIAAPAVANVSVGTVSQAESRWVNFDPWAYGNISYQVDVQGVANYTVQITNDDPMSPTNPVPPDLVTWMPDPNAGMVGASTPQFAVWQFVPLWARVLLNSGAGAVTATFVQAGVVNR